MSEYHFNEGAIDLPGSWRDASAQVLGTPAPDGSQIGLVITREPLASADAFAATVERQVTDQSRELRGFTLLGRRDSEILGLPVHEVKFQWKHEIGMMFHHQAFLALHGQLLLFTASSLAKFADECEARMVHVLGSLRIRER